MLIGCSGKETREGSAAICDLDSAVDRGELGF